MPEKNRKIPVVSGTAACMAASFFISSSDFFMLKSPFTVSLAAALDPVFSVSCLVGGIFSYVFFSDTYTVPFAVSLVIAVLIKGLFRNRNSLKTAFSASACFMLSYPVYITSEGFEPEILPVYILTSAAAGGAAYFFSELLNSPKGLADEAASNKTASSVVCAVLVSVCSSFSVSGINAGEILASFLVLVYARNYRFAGGGTAGVIAAATLLVSGTGNLRSIVFMGLGGITAGAFVNFGRPAAASSFFLTVLLCSVSSEALHELIFSYINTAAGAIAFCFVPVEKIYNEERRICSTYEEGTGAIRMLSFRMKLAAESLENAVDTAPEKTGKSFAELSGGTVRHIYDTVCGKCSGRNTCWGAKSERTYRSFRDAAESSESNFAEKFSYCYRKENIEKEFRNTINNRLVDITADEYMSRTRNILADQLRTSSEIIRNLSDNIYDSYTIDKRITERIKKCFAENDIGYSSVIAYYNSERRLFAEVYCTRNACISGYMIYRSLCSEFGRNFECTKCYDGEEIRFLISERPRYNIETDICQKSSSASEENGDTCDCFRDDYGNVYMVISDGMGTGSEASECSETAASLVRRLILGGVGIRQAVHIINSVIMARKNNEYFATLDIVKIDLDNGEMTVFKSGAAPTLFCHNGSVFSVSSRNNPLGISDNPGQYFRKIPLKAGDTVAMISDGVPEEAFGIIKKELSCCCDVSSVSDNICRIAGNISNDDISVIAARLIRQ